MGALAVESPTGSPGPAWDRPGSGRTRLLAGAVAVLAVTARVAVVARNGGPLGLSGMYDPGVYYAAAQGITFGRLPYRDVLLLHPPTVVWLLVPFAALGRAAGDPTGMAAAKVAWMLLGGLNAALVVVVARRWGLVAAATAGVFYAVLPPTVRAETAPLLEPVGTLCLLAALALLSHPHVATSARLQRATGVAAGLAPTVKIWGVVPLLLVLGWSLLRLGPRASARAATAAAAAASLVCLPLLLAAPGAMVRMVVLDQLGRGLTRTGPAERVQALVGIRWLLGTDTLRSMTGLGWAALALGVAVTVVAATDRAGRPYVVLAAAHVAVLAASPSFFDHYAAFATPALALLLAAAVGVLLRRRGPAAPAPGARWPARLTVAVLAVSLAVPLVGTVRMRTGAPFPAAALRPALAGVRCVASDSPEVLVALDVQARNLRRGCRFRPDLTGVTYDRAALPLRPGHRAVPRPQNPVWQRELMDQLTSADAVVLVRRRSDGFSSENARVVASWPVLARSGRWTVLAPAPGPSGQLTAAASPRSRRTTASISS